MILAIDGSTKSSGAAIFDGNKLIDVQCITSNDKDLIKRIYIMRDGIDNILQCYPAINQIVLEEVHPEKNLTNIKTHKALMYLQAEINFLIHDKYPNIKINYMYPSEWRKICGIKTGAGKKRDQLKPEDIKFIKDKYNKDVNDDEADAICIGHAYNINNSNKIEWE